MDLNAITGRFQALKGAATSRDARMAEVAAVRRGDVESVLPGVFPSSWPKPITANIIDTAARDIAEMLAPLPTITCKPTRLNNERLKKKALKRTKIVLHNAAESGLQKQLYSGADWWQCYGFMPIVAEPDFEAMGIRYKVEDPRGVYYELDAYGRVTHYYKSWRESVASLAQKFPQFRDVICGIDHYSGHVKPAAGEVTVVRYIGKDGTTLFLPDRQNATLLKVENPLDFVPVAVAERPKWDDEVRGSFDSTMWIQLARARMELYTMEAAKKSIRAPITAPPDVQRIPIGDDAIIRSQNPERIGRLPLSVPREVFLASDNLRQEERVSARYPEGRSGNVDASVITGQGIQALLGVIDTQLKAAQESIGRAIAEISSIALRMDEHYFPDVVKHIEGSSQGAPFSETYKPSADINGDYQVEVTYGFTAGMDPNRALVFLLQAQSAGLIDRESVMRQLPFDIDVAEIRQAIDIEKLEDATLQGIQAMMANVGVMAQQGMDPMDTLMKLTAIIKERAGGTSLTDAVTKAFTPPEPPPGEAPVDPLAALGLAAPGAGAGPGAPGGLPPEGAAPPGQSSDLAMMLAGLTPSGNANLQYNVSRMAPI